MHSSFTTKTNVALSILWFALAAAISLLSSQSMWAPIAVGATLGILAGALQLRALQESASSLVLATSALEVRRALRTSRAGRLYTYALWLSVSAIIAFATWTFRGRVGGPSGMIAGAAAFAFVREIISLPGVAALEKMSRRGS